MGHSEIALRLRSNDVVFVAFIIIDVHTRSRGHFIIGGACRAFLINEGVDMYLPQAFFFGAALARFLSRDYFTSIGGCVGDTRRGP